jgi:uncharacterized membrane protein YdjX (TVP38/TMEM64 family)
VRPIDDGEPDAAEMASYIEHFADPERPIPFNDLLSLEMSGRRQRIPFASAVKLIVAFAVLLGLTLAWNVTPLSELLDISAIKTTMVGFAASPWAPLYVIVAFMLGGLVAFPLLLLIAGTAAAFGPVLGFACAAAGSLASALLTYVIGAWLGRRPLESALGPRLNRIRARLERSGVLAIAAIRLLPIAPFTVVNMVAGASGISLVHYLLGTALGLLPGLIMLSVVGSQVIDIILHPSLSSVSLLAIGMAAWILFVLAAQALVVRSKDVLP